MCLSCISSTLHCTMPNSFIKEVSDLLDGLEKRQNALEKENAELKEELALAKALIEEGNKVKDELIEKLSKAQQRC